MRLMSIGGQCWAFLFPQLLPVRKYTEPQRDVKYDSKEEDDNSGGEDGDDDRVGDAKIDYECKQKDDSYK